MISFALLCLSIWITASPDTKEWIDRLNIKIVNIGPIFLIIATIFMTASHIVGIMATVKESVYLLHLVSG